MIMPAGEAAPPGASSPQRPASAAAPAQSGSASGRGGKGASVAEAGDLEVGAQRVRLGCEASRREDGLERAVLGEDRRCPDGADSAGAGQAIRGVAAQRDEVRHLRWLDAVALAHLRRPHPLELRSPRAWARRIVTVSEASWNASRSLVTTSVQPAPGGLRAGGGGEEVVGLVAGGLGVREAERAHELRAGGRAARSARAGTRGRPGSRGRGRFGTSATSACRTRASTARGRSASQRLASMVANPTSMLAGWPSPSRIVCGRPWKARCASESPSTTIRARPAAGPAVAIRARRPARARGAGSPPRGAPWPPWPPGAGRARRGRRPARAGRSERGRARSARAGPSRACAAGTIGTPAASAMRAVPLWGRGWWRLRSPLLRRVPSGKHRHHAPFPAERDGGLEGLAIALPAAHREGAERLHHRPQTRLPQLRLGHEVELARIEGDSQRPGIEVGRVVGGDDEAPGRRHVLEAGGAQPERAGDDRPAEPHREPVRPGRSRGRRP